MSGSPPPENRKAKSFLSNTGPDPLKNHKSTKQAFNNWVTSCPPAKFHLNGGSLGGGAKMARF